MLAIAIEAAKSAWLGLVPATWRDALSWLVLRAVYALAALGFLAVFYGVSYRRGYVAAEDTAKIESAAFAARIAATNTHLSQVSAALAMANASAAAKNEAEEVHVVDSIPPLPPIRPGKPDSVVVCRFGRGELGRLSRLGVVVAEPRAVHFAAPAP